MPTILSLTLSLVKRPVGKAICCIFLLSCISFYLDRLLPLYGEPKSLQPVVELVVETPQAAVPTESSAGAREWQVLNGPPTAAFQENLRPDVQYATAWMGAGFTNDLMSQINLIYLSLLTERVPILTPFSPIHHQHGAPTVPFGDVFDLPRLQKAVGIPILEWGQVKNAESKVVDSLGCWDLGGRHGPHWTLKLGETSDTSYTPAPSWIKNSANKQGPHLRFSALMALTFASNQPKPLAPPSRSPVHNVSLPVSQQLQCFDYLYWVADADVAAWHFNELWDDHSPAWRFVGRHMHWTPKIELLAQTYLRRAFGLSLTEPIPPYISIHVRRGDFKEWCKKGTPADRCYAPLSTYARRVEEVRAEILTTKNITVDRVIMTSDEKSSDWWEDVRALGWHSADHNRTAATYGKWYPVFIDAAIQSGSIGLVGTELSTVSKIAYKRIRSWHGGAARMVRWGPLGSDEH
ncbi:hypothetical protein C8R43DRAFT_1075303 [Mycena crocata]|nr:hypothetical protein C8R43DRAFT_1075303 [Mycena crocata]